MEKKIAKKMRVALRAVHAILIGLAYRCTMYLIHGRAPPGCLNVSPQPVLRSRAQTRTWSGRSQIKLLPSGKLRRAELKWSQLPLKMQSRDSMATS